VAEHPPADVWVHPALEVRPSPIADRGLFATQSISEDTVLLQLGGRLVDDAELAALFEAIVDSYLDTISVEAGVHLVLPHGTVAHFGNHSCDPNMWHVGPYALAARRSIEAGEEITLDYGTNSGVEGFVMACHCGSALCRGEVTGHDWRRPELQARYAHHWVPALADRIGAAHTPGAE
jgi:hypothetical protein